MPATLTLPRLGETMEEGRVVNWLKKPGDSFRRGETIVDIETDKTVVELPALADGVLIEILAADGADVKVGEPLCRYEGEAMQAPASEPAQASSASGPIALSPVSPGNSNTSVLLQGKRLRATPRARYIARQNGIDLADAQATGRRARVEAQDVEALLGRSPASAETQGDAALFCDLPAGRVAYREWSLKVKASAGAPIVLIHGFAGDSHVWQLLAANLARQGRRVLALDLPGHGQTTIEAANIEGLVNVAAAFINKLNLGAVELLGHSLGGAVAVRAARQPEICIDRVTLISPAGLGSEIDADFIDGMAHVATGGGLAHLLRRIAFRPPLLSPRQLDVMAAMIGSSERLKNLAAALVRDGRQQIDIVSDLAVIEGRVRVVWGLEDRIIPWSQAVRAGSGIPVHFISEAGHMVQWDQPQKLAALFA